MGDSRELCIDAEVDRVAEVQAFVAESIDAVDCSMKAKMQIEIAVEELFVNIANYAYNGQPGKAMITTTLDDGKVSISFHDWGIPYDPTEKEDPDITLSADERSIGGLGIYMVKKSMDKVVYERQDGQNILTISKSLFPVSKNV